MSPGGRRRNLAKIKLTSIGYESLPKSTLPGRVTLRAYRAEGISFSTFGAAHSCGYRAFPKAPQVLLLGILPQITIAVPNIGTLHSTIEVPKTPKPLNP